MSRIAAILLLLPGLCPAAASAQTAESAIERTRRLTGVDADGCLKSHDTNDIVVCGTNPENRAQRLPYPAERDPGAPPPRGEIRAASSAPIRQGSCGTVISDKCGGGLSILALVPFAAKIVMKAIDPDADVDPPPQVPPPR